MTGDWVEVGSEILGKLEDNCTTRPLTIGGMVGLGGGKEEDIGVWSGRRGGRSREEETLSSRGGFAVVCSVCGTAGNGENLG